MREVYADDAEEAMAAWQSIMGEGTAWGEYRHFENRGLRWFVGSSPGEAADRTIGVGWYVRTGGRSGEIRRPISAILRSSVDMSQPRNDGLCLHPIRHVAPVDQI